MSTVRSYLDWFVKDADPAKPWLVLGKGPSFNLATPDVLAGYNVLGLNHVSAVLPVALAHFTDWDAFADCAGVLHNRILDSTCRLGRKLPPAPALVMPWHPHVKNAPGRATLADLVGTYQVGDEVTPHSVLRAFADDNRLLSYNSDLAGGLPAHPGLPRIRVRKFSAVAAVNLLGRARVGRIYALGVDGGAQYAAEFSTWAHRRLQNGRADFDSQFAEIRRAEVDHKCVFVDLSGTQPLREAV